MKIKKAQLVVKFILLFKIMTLMKEAVPANSVPAAAVIRGGRALLTEGGLQEVGPLVGYGELSVLGRNTKAQPWWFPLN